MGLVGKVCMALIAAACLAGWLLLSHFTFEAESIASAEACTDSDEEQQLRRSITFLLGEDKPGYSYFSLAEAHFLFDEQEKTDVLVKSCRSLEDLIYYLNHHSGSFSWETIQIVLHGNPYNGLSLPIVNDGPRATPRNLIKAMLKGTLPKLQTNALDTCTRINFWACGIGKSPFINIALDSFFRLPDGRLPLIYTSPHFVVFKEVGKGVAPKRLRASYWPYIFKRGYRPGDVQISRELARQFPEAGVNWRTALQSSQPNDRQAEFQNSFHIPVSWTAIYPTKASRPSVKTKEEKMKWIQSQPELMSRIEELNIPIDKFTWTVNKIIHTNEQGKRQAAIKAIGMATVMCVLEEV